MAREKQTTHTLYKGHYFFAFYTIDDERLMYTFDNFFQICQYLSLETSSANLAMLQRKIVSDIKYHNNKTYLFGMPMLVYLIDMDEDEEDSDINFNEKEDNQNGKQNQNYSDKVNFSHIGA